MKLNFIIFLFILSSLALLYSALEGNASVLYAEYLKKNEEKKELLMSSKSYKKTRKEYTPTRSVSLANRAVQRILLQTPIEFESNSSSLVFNVKLARIAKIINHLNEQSVLSITAHTDDIGSMQDNLLLSQKRADNIKKYFLNKINLPLVVAIGYGEALSLKKESIKINLKRI